MLDAVVDYLPSPLDVPPIEGHTPGVDEPGRRLPDDDEPFAAIAFKIANDPFVGNLTFFRVYSGTLKSGSYVYNATQGQRERIGRVLQMHANHREDIEEVRTGDIAAAIGLKSTTTGDTLCSEDAPDRPGGDGLPGAGDLGRRRAQDQGRPGQDGRSPSSAWPPRTPPSGSAPTRTAARP